MGTARLRVNAHDLIEQPYGLVEVFFGEDLLAGIGPSGLGSKIRFGN